MQALLIISGGSKNPQTCSPKDHLSPKVVILWSNISGLCGQQGPALLKFNLFGERVLFTAAKELP